MERAKGLFGAEDYVVSKNRGQTTFLNGGTRKERLCHSAVKNGPLHKS
jgi:hypothetical protein